MVGTPTTCKIFVLEQHTTVQPRLRSPVWCFTSAQENFNPCSAPEAVERWEEKGDHVRCTYFDFQRRHWHISSDLKAKGLCHQQCWESCHGSYWDASLQVRAKEEQHVSGPRHWEAIQEGIAEALNTWHCCSHSGRKKGEKREKHQVGCF